MTSKILVVDDSITIQKIVAMAFEKEDACVEGIGNGSEALVKLKKFKPDIVLADVNMPGLNGFELSKKIKESSEFDSVSVLLLTSDFEDFDENLFRDSLADDHITKPFKSEDIVRKAKELLSGIGGSSPMEDDEVENMITLSPIDRMEEETVMELGENQLMDPPEEISLDEEEIHLELSGEDTLINLENPEHEELVVGLEEEGDVADQNAPEDDPAVTIHSSSEDDPESVKDSLQSEKQVPEESLDELIRRVEELSKKSEAIREQRSSEELQPLETLDEMIKEVNALKKVPTTVVEEGNGIPKTFPPPDTADVDTVIAETNYISEENAEELEAAFNAIILGNKLFSPSSSSTLSDQTAAANEDKEIVPEAETFLNDLEAHPFATSLANPVQDPEIETHPQFLEEEQVREEKNLATDEIISPVQSSQENLISEVMEKEIRKIIDQSLSSLMEKEIPGLHEKVIKSVEEIVREIVPDIVKTVIEKEIVKNQKQG